MEKEVWGFKLLRHSNVFVFLSPQHIFIRGSSVVPPVTFKDIFSSGLRQPLTEDTYSERQRYMFCSFLNSDTNTNSRRAVDEDATRNQPKSGI